MTCDLKEKRDVFAVARGSIDVSLPIGEMDFQIRKATSFPFFEAGTAGGGSVGLVAPSLFLLVSCSSCWFFFRLLPTCHVRLCQVYGSCPM